MRKNFLIFGLSLVGLIILILLYLSVNGIKTNKFNHLINDKLKGFDEKLSLKTNDIFLKLKLNNNSININIDNPKIYSDSEFIDLSKIDINLDLIKLIKNDNSIKNIQIVSKENSIKRLTNFITSYKFNIPRLVIFNQIESGNIQATTNIYFDEENQNDFTYEVIGKVNNAKLNTLNETFITNINFNFNIKNQIFNFDNINLKYDNIDFQSKKTRIKKSGKNFEIKGDLSNKKGLIKPNSFLKLVNFNLDFLEKKEISMETENEFSFNINSNRLIKDLNLKSSLKFDELYFNKKYQDLIYLEDVVVEATFYDENFAILIDSKYSFLNEKYNNKENKNSIKSKIKKESDKNISVETFLKNKKNKINSKEFTKYFQSDQNFFKDQNIIFGSDSKITFEIDKNKKIKNLRVKSNLNFDNIKIDYISNRIKKRIPNYKNHIFLNSDYLELDYSKNKTLIKAKGKYSFNDKFDDYEINIINVKDKFDFETFINLSNNSIVIDEIDYTNNNDLPSTLMLKANFIKNKDIKVEHVLYSEDKNIIAVSNLQLSKDYKVKDIEELELNYLNKNKKKNYIKIIKNNNNYVLIGDHFDGSSLINNLLNGDSNNSFLKIFQNLNSEIVLNLDKLYSGHQSYLKNIEGKLIVKNNKIQSGKINALLNKENKFSLNIKTDSKNEKVTNLYIEKPEPFIKNYKFIRGFDEGSLSYDSVEKNGLSKSKLKIYDFKVKEVPVLASILTLASLQGIADLLTGEGIRFDEFEMDYESSNNKTTVNEMYVIGPAISILMEGYIVKNKLTSLRGTLVPATTINKTISKIPLLGNILVGKKVGEGVFGVSFKIKGPPKNLKTTVNPIKTLTPRFITRTVEKLKRKN
jgi:hypothetical protein